ncbi:MAG: TolC family protein [Oscillospiraceae bacterium]|nr:TolC family protein [Oscillospiraceae bacterium]
MSERKENLRAPLSRLAAVIVCCAMLLALAAPISDAALTPRTFTLEQTQRMAISSSSEITKQNNQIILKRMKYVEAVEGIRAKVKNLKSFRWSPLLSFKFPQQLALTEDYDLNIKPLTLQTEIDNLVHGLNDLKYEVTHKVNGEYFEVYALQESVEFTQARLDDAAAQLEANNAKLLTGGATQTDVDRAKKTVDTLTSELSSQLRDFQTAKEKLSKTVGVDVTVGYEFANGFKTAFIPREDLAALTDYTLNHDQLFYETKAATATALLNVESYEDFMRGEYGSKMNKIQSYIDAAKQGLDVDYGAFQIDYREMLKTLDKPWAGKMRILFFTFTMEWFKGEIDGTRYIEDEMYAVYTACMEYGNAKRDQDSAEAALRAQVRDTYESLVVAWNSYLTLRQLARENETTLERLVTLNALGKATYGEVADGQTAYQDAQMDALDALLEYNNILSEFDRLTCGAVTKYLKDGAAALNVGEGGDAFAMLDPINDPYYYIYTSVADLAFHIGVSIPDGFEPAIDSFEVWYGGTQIGARTDVGTELRHLAMDYKDTSKLTIRLYNGDTYVDECEVDASVPRDVLPIEGVTVEETERVVGTYTVETSVMGDTAVSQLTLSVDAAVGADSYTLGYGGGQVYTAEKYPLRKAFHYFTLLVASLEDVTATLYNADGEKLTDVRFDTQTQTLVMVSGAE